MFLFCSIARSSFFQIVAHDLDRSLALQSTSLNLVAVLSPGGPSSYEKAEPKEKRLLIPILGIFNITQLQTSAHSDFQPVLLLGCF